MKQPSAYSRPFHLKLAKTSGSGFVKISGLMVGYISCAMMAALTSKWPLSQTLTIRPFNAKSNESESNGTTST